MISTFCKQRVSIVSRKDLHLGGTQVKKACANREIATLLFQPYTEWELDTVLEHWR